MALGHRVREARKARGMTQTELADKVGVTPAAIQALESRDSDSSRYAVAIATTLNVNPEWLSKGLGPRDLTNVDVAAVPAFPYPIISWVTAGMWEEVIDLHAAGVAEDWVYSTYKGSPNTFALRVRGDSMVNPTGTFSFPEGLIIVVDPNIQAENGSYIVARLNGSMEATFKQLVIDGDQRYLKPLNPRYPIIPITEECQICGVVKAAEMRF